MTGKEAVKTFEIDAVTFETHSKLHPGVSFALTVAGVMDFLGDLARTGRDFDVFTVITMRVCNENEHEAQLVQQVWQRYVDTVCIVQGGGQAGFVFHDVDGWLGPEEAELLYRVAHGNVVEIGSYKGRSTLCLAQGVRDHGGHVITVDHMTGSPGEPDHEPGYETELRENLRRHGLDGYVTVWATTSEAAASRCESADFVFIDGDHEQAGQDAELWAPKTNLIAFHDNDRAEVGLAILGLIRKGWLLKAQAGCTMLLERGMA